MMVQIQAIPLEPEWSCTMNIGNHDKNKIKAIQKQK